MGMYLMHVSRVELSIISFDLSDTMNIYRGTPDFQDFGSKSLARSLSSTSHGLYERAEVHL